MNTADELKQIEKETKRVESIINSNQEPTPEDLSVDWPSKTDSRDK